MSSVCIVVAPNWVGDAIMSEVLIARLHSQYTRIDVLAVPWVKQVYEGMPGVSEILDNPLRHGSFPWHEARTLATVIADRGYAQAFILPLSLKSALIPYWAKIPIRTGYLGELRYFLVNDIRVCSEKEPCSNRYAMLADLPPGSPLVRPVLAVDQLQSYACAERLSLSLERPIVILAPGAEFGPAKRWPATHFAEVASRFIDWGGDVWILGSPKDYSVAQDIATIESRVVVLCGRTNLHDARLLLPLADCVISNDSGLMHMASALSLPTIAIYGSTDPMFAPPTSTVSRSFYLNLPCSPCRQRVCPLHHHRCMQDITPESVWSQVMIWMLGKNKL